MIKLTFWAKNNPHFAQLLITIGHLLTAFLCIQLGIRLLILGVECPNWVFYLLGELFILAVWLYPSKSDMTAQPKRVIRRSFHAVFLMLGVLITTIEANRLTSIGLDESVAILENTSVNISPNTNSGVAKNVVYRTENQRIDNKVFRNKPAVQSKQ